MDHGLKSKMKNTVFSKHIEYLQSVGTAKEFLDALILDLIK